jgi:hypothetical protein
MPLGEATELLQQLGINHRAGLAEIVTLSHRHSPSSVGGDDRDRIISTRSTKRFGWRLANSNRLKMSSAALAGAMAATLVFVVWQASVTRSVANSLLYLGAPRIVDPVPVAASVERAHKGDQIARPFGIRADAPMIDVEVNGRIDVAITLRYRDGQVIFRADPVNHVTTMAKSVSRKPEKENIAQRSTIPGG